MTERCNEKMYFERKRNDKENFTHGGGNSLFFKLMFRP